jgi:hypothetical protein
LFVVLARGFWFVVAGGGVVEEGGDASSLASLEVSFAVVDDFGDGFLNVVRADILLAALVDKAVERWFFLGVVALHVAFAGDVFADGGPVGVGCVVEFLSEGGECGSGASSEGPCELGDAVLDAGCWSLVVDGAEDLVGAVADGVGLGEEGFVSFLVAVEDGFVVDLADGEDDGVGGGCGFGSSRDGGVVGVGHGAMGGECGRMVL